MLQLPLCNNSSSINNSSHSKGCTSSSNPNNLWTATIPSRWGFQRSRPTPPLKHRRIWNYPAWRGIFLRSQQPLRQVPAIMLRLITVLVITTTTSLQTTTTLINRTVTHRHRNRWDKLTISKDSKTAIIACNQIHRKNLSRIIPSKCYISKMVSSRSTKSKWFPIPLAENRGDDYDGGALEWIIYEQSIFVHFSSPQVGNGFVSPVWAAEATAYASFRRLEEELMRFSENTTVRHPCRSHDSSPHTKHELLGFPVSE